ncbi:radical SAM protein [Nanoarchaeota archaeon]
MDKRKVLIIKTGYSEFLDRESNSRKVSLGDVLRTTTLLHLYKDDHITWVTDEYAFPLLENNKYIHRLLHLDLLTIKQLEMEEFDILINLEKVPGICALSDKIKAWKKHGFRFDSKTGEARAYDKAFEVLTVGSDPELKKENKKTAQELLFEIVGEKWNNEEYILGEDLVANEIYDVGLNTQIGQKWSTKAWPIEKWDKIEELLTKEGFRVGRQDKQGPEVLQNIRGYMNWINSCKLIISNDSLGLHLALALKKKVIGLFGPTPHKEFYFYGQGKAILPESDLDCIPCFEGVCKKGRNCMQDISIEKVYDEIKDLLQDYGLKRSELDITQVDNHKLIYHPERIDEWKRRQDCYPLYVEIGLTNACNHKCTFCALDFLENGTALIDRDIMLKSLKEMSEKGVKSIMFGGEGESVLHKDICFFTQKAKEFGLDVSITTNGVHFSKDKIQQCLPFLSWIRFSVDSGSPENYSQIHGCPQEDFYKVIENIRECIKLKKENNLNIIIGVQFLAIPQNLGEAVKLARILKEIGADNLQIKPYSKHPSSINNLILDEGEYNQLEKPLMEFNDSNFKVLFRRATAQRIEQGIDYPECYGLPFFTLIDSKGNVLPCNLFYNNEEFTYGNLYKNSFSEIWEGIKRKEILEKLKLKGCEDCRHGCRLDAINRYLHRLKKPQLHDSFI